MVRQFGAVDLVKVKEKLVTLGAKRRSSLDALYIKSQVLSVGRKT